LSPSKISQQKFVVCHAKIGRFCRPIKSSDFVVQHRTRSILDDKIGQLFGYRSTDFVCVIVVIFLQWGGEYLFQLLFCCCLLYNIYFRLLDAEKNKKKTNNASIMLCILLLCIRKAS